MLRLGEQIDIVAEVMTVRLMTRTPIRHSSSK
jgi:hypothetical protein